LRKLQQSISERLLTMRKILFGSGLTLGISTLLTAGPSITFNFENGEKSTFTVSNGQRISQSDLKHKLWKTGVMREGYMVEFKDEAKAPIPSTQVFKGRIAVNLWVTLVKVSKEDNEISISSPVSLVKKRSKKDATCSPSAM